MWYNTMHEIKASIKEKQFISFLIICVCDSEVDNTVSLKM